MVTDKASADKTAGRRSRVLMVAGLSAVLTASMVGAALSSAPGIAASRSSPSPAPRADEQREQPLLADATGSECLIVGCFIRIRSTTSHSIFQRG